jgi:hypothetical protein
MGFLAMIGVLSALLGTGQSEKQLQEAINRSVNPTDGDYQLMRKAGDKAFVLLLPKVERRNAMDKKLYPNRRDRNTELYNQVWLLCACATEKRTPEMTRLYRVARDREQDMIFTWLAYVGEPTSNRALFESFVDAREAERKRFAYDRRPQEAAAALLRIGDSKAVQLLADVLLDDKALGPVRHTIYLSIARTASPIALAALRKAKACSREWRMLGEVVKEANRSPWAHEGIPARHTDSQDKKWGLIYLDALGSTQDLWLVNKQDGKWTDPVFTGVSTYWPRSYTGGNPTKGEPEYLAKMDRFITNGEWKQLIGSPELTLDSDKDGFTDVVERWLALDPQNTDSDGDGLKDSVDKNPHAMSRPLNENEQILQAALDAAVFGRTDIGRNLIVAFPEGVQPIEVTCWPGLVLSKEAEARATRPDALFGFGIRFGSKGQKALKILRPGLAEVSMTEDGGWYMNGYIIVLKRFGVEWLPIRYRSLWSAAA